MRVYSGFYVTVLITLDKRDMSFDYNDLLAKPKLYVSPT